MICLKWWKGKPFDMIKNTLPGKPLVQIWQRNQKLYRQAKARRIKHHQTSFRIVVKGTSLEEKKRSQLKTRKLRNKKAHQ